MQRIAARPHHLGSPYDKDNAEWILARFKEWGLDARIETLRCALSNAERRVPWNWWRPRGSWRSSRSRRLLRILPPDQQAEQLPTYNAYSVDGDVTAPLVYVNFGIPEDYEQLERLGISVKGRNRHRPLRRLLARHQAEGRGRAWGGRLPDLLGPPRGRLCSRARSFRRDRTGRVMECSAAVSWTCRYIPAIRLLLASALRPTRNGCR